MKLRSLSTPLCPAASSLWQHKGQQRRCPSALGATTIRLFTYLPDVPL